MIEIKNRFTNAVIMTLDCEDLRSADLSCANLYGANLRGVDLSCANLYGANLSSANLYGADLYGANLYRVDLRDADLSGAILFGAKLDAKSGAVVSRALGIEPDAKRAAAVLWQITARPETWEQKIWHSECGTRHCVAGWAVKLDGDRGALLERLYGTETAASILLAVPGTELPSFAGGATNDETVGRLRKIAETVLAEGITATAQCSAPHKAPG